MNEKIKTDTTKTKHLTSKYLFDIFINLALLLTGAYYLTCTLFPDSMDGDMIVQFIASINNPTLFFWGQDRLLSLTTFLLIPYKNVELNLFLGTFINAIYLSGILIFTCSLYSKKASKKAALFLSSLLAIRIILPDTELFTFAKAAQPYAPSMLFLSIAFFTGFHSQYKKKEHFIFTTALILSTISLLLNPLILIYAFCFPLAYAVLNINSKRISHAWGPIMAKWLIIIVMSLIVFLTARHLYIQYY